jgi:hypothetical protein
MSGKACRPTSDTLSSTVKSGTEVVIDHRLGKGMPYPARDTELAMHCPISPLHLNGGTPFFDIINVGRILKSDQCSSEIRTGRIALLSQSGGMSTSMPGLMPGSFPQIPTKVVQKSRNFAENVQAWKPVLERHQNALRLSASEGSDEAVLKHTSRGQLTGMSSSSSNSSREDVSLTYCRAYSKGACGTPP